MNPESLNKFLATVRRTRFIDYLDPIGVTAQEALSQRIRWAQRNLDDPQHGDEAAFLVAHASDLIEVLRHELEVDADDEWTDVFAGVKADSPLLTWMRRDDVADPGTAGGPPPRVATVPAPPPPESPEGLHLTRLEDITPPPMDASEVQRALDEAAASEQAGKAGKAGNEPSYVTFADEENSDAETLVVDRAKLGIPDRLHRRTPTPAPVAARTATPGPVARSATPAPASRTATPAPASRTATPAPASRTATPIDPRRKAFPAPTPSMRPRSIEPPPPRTPVRGAARRVKDDPTRPIVPLLLGGMGLMLAAFAAWLFLFGGPEPETLRTSIPVPLASRVAAQPEAVTPAGPLGDGATDDVAAAEDAAPNLVDGPEPVVAPEPPAPEPVAAVVAPEPVAAVVEPAPDPEPVKAVVAPTIAPAVAATSAVPSPAPQPQGPAPRPSGMPDLTGNWTGDADGAPLRLHLESAGGPRVSGTAEIDTPDGRKHLSVSGTWKDGRAELSGRGDALLFGYLDATGGNGTLMIPGVEPLAWNLAAR